MESEEENKEDTLETKKNSAVSTKKEEITRKVGKRNKRERPSKVTELQKNRAKSVESILDFYGRKRERPEEEGEEEEERATVKRCNSAADQLSPAEKERDEEIKTLKSSMDFAKLEIMTNVKQMIIMLAKSMSTKEDIKEEMKQLRQSIEAKRKIDRKRIEEIDKKINRSYEELEKKIENMTEKRENIKSVEPERDK